MTDLSEYLKQEAVFWTDFPHLQEKRPRRRERAARLAQAADIVECYNTTIEELQQLCSDFGCLGGQHRIKWLRSRLERLRELEGVSAAT